MKTRPAFSLRPQLFVWSLALALFSIWGAYRTFGGIFSDAKEYVYCILYVSLPFLQFGVKFADISCDHDKVKMNSFVLVFSANFLIILTS